MEEGMSLTKIKNRSGPKILPSGTPENSERVRNAAIK